MPTARSRIILGGSFILLILALLSLRLLSTPNQLLVIGPDSVDFGRYDAWQKKTARYRIRNEREKQVRITKVINTCACASTKIDRLVLNPHEEAILEVVILPNSIFGKYSKSTYLETDHPENRFLKFKTDGEAVPLVEVKPGRFFYIGRISGTSTWSKTFTLHPTRPDVALNIPETVCSCPARSELRSDRTGDWSLNVSLEPTGTSGDLDCTVSVPVIEPTGHPPVKIHISGKVGRELNAVPGTFNVPPSDNPVKKQFRLRILGGTVKHLEPGEIQLPADKNVSFFIERDPDNTGLIGEAVFSPDFTRELMKRKEIILSLDIKGAGPARIRCRTTHIAQNSSGPPGQPR